VRIRSVKPEFWQSLTIAKVGLQARLLIVGLWCYCDDHGRGIDNPALIRGTLFPLDLNITLEEVESWLEELRRHRLIVRYHDPEDRPLLAIRSWSEHQHPQRPQASRWAAPPRVAEPRQEALPEPLPERGPEPGPEPLQAEDGEGVGGEKEGRGEGVGGTTKSAPATAIPGVDAPGPADFIENGQCPPDLAAALGSETATHNLEAIAREDPRWLELRPSYIRALNGGGREPWRRHLVGEALSRLRASAPAWASIDDPAAYLAAVVEQIETEAVAIHGGGEAG
jgi:hypothetical protein